MALGRVLFARQEAQVILLSLINSQRCSRSETWGALSEPTHVSKLGKPFFEAN